MDRKQVIASLLSPSGRGLEIGPSYNPIFPKRSGARVETLDHVDQAGLVEKYREHPNVDVRRIEPVDFVCDGRSMAEVIGRTGCYDYIVASHVIEHTPNLVGFLNDCDLLLNDGGVLLLVVPDKRYCFDALRPVSSTGDVLQAFWDKRTRHTPGAVFDHFAYGSRRGEAIAWSSAERTELKLMHTFDEAIFRADGAKDPGPYVDCHAWRFTPANFRLIAHDLNAIGLIRLKERGFHGTEGCEFFVSLSRAGQGPNHSRLELAQMALREAAQVRVPRFGRHPLVAAAAGAAVALGQKWRSAKRPGISPRALKRMVKRVRRALHG
ncbi:MAG TPA: methyltransferase domain-containing protein [Geminicoccaceae bacterium]|nr:methyltransferase domain-containing protein [Geminicoccaceae bacterium]